MKVVNNIFLHLRIQRRRHRNLFLSSFVLLSLSIIFLIYCWQDYADKESQSVVLPDEDCIFLPSFICNWRSRPAAGEPFNPSSVSKHQAQTQEEKDREEKDREEEARKLAEKVHKKKLKKIKELLKAEDGERLALGHSFYKNIFKDIIAAKPKLHEKLGKYADGKLVAERYEEGNVESLVSEKYLSSFLQINDAQLEALTKSHQYIKGRLPEKAPFGLYKGDGIVYVGGGKFNWLTLLSIKGLRGDGCDLPIEILVPDLEEYDIELCSKVFPALNAKCIYLPAALYGDDLEFASHLTFKGYQYKSLAILLSSFENVLLLDGDNMAAYSPAHLFKNEPFLSNGLVVWPDYWRRSTSPRFYQIAGEEVSTRKLLPKYFEKIGFYQEQSQSTSETFDWFEDVPFHERVGAIPDPSSESGQLLISKKSHLKALLLALYYNSYGPGSYYPILSQGASGEGDKETFLAATVVLKKTFYQVGQFLMSMGNIKDGAFTGHGMGQFDPVEDYRLNLDKKEVSAKLKGEKLTDALSEFATPKILFLHANFPKLDPWALKENGETIDKDGRHRLFGWSLKRHTGKDLELVIWKHMNSLLCEAKLDIDYFKNVSRKLLCEEINAQLKHLENTAAKMLP